MKNRQKIYKIVSIFLILDQIIKILIKTKMNLYQEIIIIPNFFSLLYVKNSGAAFSILSNSTFLLIVLSVIFILFLDKYIKKENNKFDRLTIISFGIIMGGIFGNLMDRLLYHSVIDYLSFNIFGYPFAIFNLADIGITIGAVLLVIGLWKNKEQKEKI